jgi:SAM-dependent methyltransferase
VTLEIEVYYVNLSPDKKKVFQEAYRVLKAGGRILISDIVTHALPQKIRNNMSAWVGCVAGALEEEEYLTTIWDTGFKDVEVVGRMVFDEAMVKGMLSACEVDNDQLEGALTLTKKEGFQNGMIWSIKVKASK